jgi:hypothetical protein
MNTLLTTIKNRIFKLTALIILLSLNFTASYSQLYNTAFTISDGAQKHQIAFDALGFISGDFCACSFIPPGKVADYFGFQYLRDNDITRMGHNSDFSGVIGNNLLYVLDSTQKAEIISMAIQQVDIVKQYAYLRLPLIKAFVRMRDNDMPTGSLGLDSSAVKEYSAALYRVDGLVCLQRAQLYSKIINALNATQRHYLDSISLIGEKNMPDLPLQIDKRPLNNDQFVGVMSLADDIYSWYVGNVDADVYMCPERQGNYFGSFYLKDAPAMGVANYSIDTTLSQTGGDRFLATLTTSQASLITSLVNTQRVSLNGIVARRTDISILLRKYLSSQVVDTNAVLSLSEEYGKLDGLLSYYYATNFSKVNWTLSSAQRDSMMSIRNLSDYPCTGAYLYSEAIAEPTIENTDYLFLRSAAGVNNAKNSRSTYVCTPNPFVDKINIRNTSGNELYELTKIDGQLVWGGKFIEQNDFSYLPQGVYLLNIKADKSTETLKLFKK